MASTRTLRILFLFLWAGNVLFSADYALAQEKQSSSSTADEDSLQLEQMVVTSQKTESTKQEVSSNVSVLDGYTLEDLGTETIEQIVGLTPNISFYRPDNHLTYLVYRGIGGTTNMNKAYNINYDGVTIPYAALNTSLDIERIELMRGSQGTLYGSNTHSGVVNVITRDPGDTFEGYTRIGYGSYDTQTFQSAFGGPLGENTKYRLALGYQQSGGYFTNIYLHDDECNEGKQISVHGKLIYQTPEAGKFTLAMLADSYDDNIDNTVAGGGYNTLHNDSGYNDGSVVSPTLTWEKSIGDIAITSITNYTNSNYGFLTDWDHVSQDLYMFEFDENYNTFTEEFRMEGKAGKLKWMSGLFLMAESLETDGLFWYGTDSGAYAGISSGQDSSVDSREAALFGQVTYRFLPQFEATAGLRFDYTEKEMDWTGLSSYAASVDKFYDDDWMELLPSASIAWVPNESQRVYFSFSRGFKAGDFNNVQMDADVVTEPVDPEYTTTYEIGYKGLFADDRFEVNFSAFYINWDDLQVDSLLDSSAASSAYLYIKQNAAKAHSSGLEIELRSKLTRELMAFVSAGYMLEYEFDEYPDSSSGDLSGYKLPGTNEYSLGCGFIWRSRTGFFLASNLRFYGPKYFDEANLKEQDSYTLVDAKLGYETDKWGITIYGRNLLDEEYTVSVGASQDVETSGEPLVGGVQLSFYF